jgi:hypothetical protein
MKASSIRGRGCGVGVPPSGMPQAPRRRANVAILTSAPRAATGWKGQPVWGGTGDGAGELVRCSEKVSPSPVPAPEHVGSCSRAVC